MGTIMEFQFSKLIVAVLACIILTNIYLFYDEHIFKLLKIDESNEKIKFNFIFGGAEFVGFSMFMYLHKSGIKNVTIIDTFDNPSLIKSKRIEILKDMMNADMLSTDSCKKRINSFKNSFQIEFVIIDPRFDILEKDDKNCFILFPKLLQNKKYRSKYDTKVIFISSNSNHDYMRKTLFAEYFEYYSIKYIDIQIPSVFGPWGSEDKVYSISYKIINSLAFELHKNSKNQYEFIGDTVKRIGLNIVNNSSNDNIHSTNFYEIDDYQLVKFIEYRFNKSALVTFGNKNLYSDIHENKTIPVSFQKNYDEFQSWIVLETNHDTYCSSECSQNEKLCVTSSYDLVIRESIYKTRFCETVVYTVIINKKVKLIHPPSHPLTDMYGNSCYIAFISQDSPLGKTSLHKHGVWNLIRVNDDSYFNSRKYSRIPKLSPGKFFSKNVLYAIYIDAKLQLNNDPYHFIDYLKQNNTVLVGVRHAFFRSVFNEFQTILWANRSKQTYSLKRQNLKYSEIAKSKNYSFNNLIEGSILMHNLKLENARLFRCKWFREYMNECDRDQTSFAYVLWKAAYDINQSLTSKQEWCPVSLNNKNQFEFVRLLSNKLHYHYSQYFAIVKGHASYT